MLFPDEYVTRFFFKEQLNERSGARVLEIGCGDGQNLELFSRYGWDVCGIDLDQEALVRARERLGNCNHVLVSCDLSRDFPDEISGHFDVILMASATYYFGRRGRRNVLLKSRELLGPGGLVFLRERLLDDYRFGRGVEEDENTFRLSTPETGEAGLSVSFYSEVEIVDALRGLLRVDLGDLTILRNRFENLQDGRVISNSDLIGWGKRPT